jgi:superfamily II DNA or RNA helicase
MMDDHGYLFDEEPNYSSPTFPEPRDFQKQAHESLRAGVRQKHRCQILIAPTGGGKCLGRDTPVLMADGSVRMVQDVCAGDQLLGPDGGVRNVLSVTSGQEQMYRVTPKKGAPYEVNASHILSLRKTPGSDGLILADGTHIPPDADVVNVNVETLLNINATARHCLKGWRSGAIEFHGEKSVFLLEPYWLGCWLGDGHQGMPALSSPPCKMVDYWKRSAAKFGYEIVVMQSRDGDCPSWRIVSRYRSRKGSVANFYVSELDYYGLRQRKHIPRDYMTASIDARLHLIAGMIDSDGSLAHNGYDWISKYEDLARDFAFVCRSVGLAAYVAECRKNIASCGFMGTYWRVSVSGDVDRIPCLDKIAAPPGQKKRHLVHGIQIEPIGEGDYYGFEIDGDHLFLLGDFTVTHNTYLGLRIAHEALLKGRRALFVCDRSALINQTSQTADEYGLSAHGIIQANHPRRNSRMPFQIASIQTLAKREWWPKADVIIIDECFSGDVEVLTERGFIRFDELPRGVRCAQFDDGKISFVEPTRYIDKEFCGEMVRLHSKGTCDLLMTPDHEMILTSVSGATKRVAIKDAPLNQRWEIPVAGHAIGGCNDELSPMDRLLIALQADGSMHNKSEAVCGSLSFSFAKERKIDRFLALMEDGGFRFTECRSSRGIRRFIVHGLPLVSKNIWEFFDLAEMGGARAKAIISEMVEWDGSKVSKSCWYYSSVDKRAAEFYQCVALLAGYRARTTVQRDGRSAAFNDVHRLFIHLSRSTIGAQSLKRDSVLYAGRVYCVSVPSGNIIVRRGGKALVTGNCHTQHKAWVDFIQKTDAKVIGLTATPTSVGLGKLFSNHVNAATMNELTKSGVLVPMRTFICEAPDMTGAETSGGEWTDKAAAERSAQIIGDVVTEWRFHAEGRKTIIFGASIAYCEELCGRFNSVGINAAVFTSETGDTERDELLKEYRKPDSRLRILISVEALAKGFDVPDVECVVDCRPLRKSLSTVIQMWGRGLRSSPKTGKKDCVLLDHSGNVLRFKEDYEEIFFNGFRSLDMGEKLDKIVREEPKESKGCPNCGNQPFSRRCICCGFELVKESGTLEAAGVMREIAMSDSADTTDYWDIWKQCCTIARGEGNPATANGRAFYWYQHVTGRKKLDSWRFETTPNTPITRPIANKIKRYKIKFAKRRPGVAT